jgi:prevent-host-death family protein
VERIGIRELRQNASAWIARAQGGETIDITSHGRLVARLVQVSEADTRGMVFDFSDLLDHDEGPSMTEILDEMRKDR